MQPRFNPWSAINEGYLAGARCWCQRIYSKVTEIFVGGAQNCTRQPRASVNRTRLDPRFRRLVPLDVPEVGMHVNWRRCWPPPDLANFSFSSILFMNYQTSKIHNLLFSLIINATISNSNHRCIIDTTPLSFLSKKIAKPSLSSILSTEEIFDGRNFEKKIPATNSATNQIQIDNPPLRAGCPPSKTKTRSVEEPPLYNSRT